MKRRRNILTTFCLMATLCFLSCKHEIKPTLKLSKTEYTVGETIEIEFRAPSYFVKKAWIGIIPSEVPHGDETVNDKHDLTYQYIEKRTKGVIRFPVPNKNGQFDIRMNDTNTNGTEVASVSFTISGATETKPKTVASKNFDASKVTFQTDKPLYIAKESIKIRFTGLPGNQKDWMTLVKAEAAENTYKEWYYTKGKTAGDMQFKGLASGQYEARLYFNWPDGGYTVQKRYAFTVN